jgi:hypothetical protein
MSMESLEGGWFSTSDLKLAVALHAAGFAFRHGSEVTRIVLSGRESFTWHFHTTNSEGRHIAEFLQQWEKEADASSVRPDSMTCFLLAREVMFTRTHIIAQSHAAPEQIFYQRGDKRLIVSKRLGREEREALARMAS